MSKILTTSMSLDAWLYAQEQHIKPALVLNKVVADLKAQGYSYVEIQDVQSGRYKKRLVGVGISPQGASTA